MSMSDPLADMLTRIRNGQKSKLMYVDCPHSNLKENVLKVLQSEGFINGYTIDESGSFKVLEIELKFQRNGEGAIKEISRVSKPGKRVASSISKLLPHYNGLGIYILSTSKGVVSDRIARSEGVGGEVICKVY